MNKFFDLEIFRILNSSFNEIKFKAEKEKSLKATPIF